MDTKIENQQCPEYRISQQGIETQVFADGFALRVEPKIGCGLADAGIAMSQPSA